MLSPAKIEEAELRIMAYELLDVWSLASQFGNDLTLDELRQLLHIKKTGRNMWALLVARRQHPVGEQKAKQDAQIRAVLGEMRYQGDQRAQELEFRFIYRHLDNLVQPIEVTWRVYDLRHAASREAERVKQDPQLTSERRQEALFAIQRETETALAQVMGGSAAQKYIMQ